MITMAMTTKATAILFRRNKYDRNAKQEEIVINLMNNTGGPTQGDANTGGRFCCVDKFGDICYNFVEVMGYAKITKTKKL